MDVDGAAFFLQKSYNLLGMSFVGTLKGLSTLDNTILLEGSQTIGWLQGVWQLETPAISWGKYGETRHYMVLGIDDYSVFILFVHDYDFVQKFLNQY